MAMQYLERVRIPEQADKYPSQLSGGQQQRVAIARALCMTPKIMLFDEPTSALDPEMVKEVLDTMIGLADDGMTMLCVTHEMGFARSVADRVIFMAEGEIVEQAPPQQFFSNPQHEKTRDFLGQILSSHHGAPLNAPYPDFTVVLRRSRSAPPRPALVHPAGAAAGADGVEVRGELLTDPQSELPALARAVREAGLAVVYSSPEGLWHADGALDQRAWNARSPRRGAGRGAPEDVDRRLRRAVLGQVRTAGGGAGRPRSNC